MTPYEGKYYEWLLLEFSCFFLYFCATFERWQLDWLGGKGVAGGCNAWINRHRSR